jgi:hypothetical protein
MARGRTTIARLGTAALVVVLLSPGRAGASTDVTVFGGRGASVAATLADGFHATATFLSGAIFDGGTLHEELVCITVTDASGATDRGCSTEPTSNDPDNGVDIVLGTGTVRFTIPSETYPGGTLTASISLSASGAVGTGDLDGDGRTFRVCAPQLPGCTGDEVTLDTDPALYRDALPDGSVVSSTLGGGFIDACTCRLLGGFKGRLHTTGSPG